MNLHNYNLLSFTENRPWRSSISQHLCFVSTGNKEIIKIIVVSQSRYIMFFTLHSIAIFRSSNHFLFLDNIEKIQEKFKFR